MKDGLQRKRPMELHLAQHLITGLCFDSAVPYVECPLYFLDDIGQIFTFKFSVALLRLSGATILDGTWKNTYSIPNFRFYCNIKKRTGKHDTLTIPKKKLDLFSIAPKTAMAVEQFHTAIWHSVLGVD
ncbi:hypothetical protein NC652_000095 [Populus alba x Populus x berolinensis]|nr:hypothetical protein NC652_000095 [Populus alba x Populus x berolinensis]